LLKKLAKEGLSGSAVAKKLKRTPAAVYQYASANGVSFRAGRAKKKRRAGTRR
jgi:predicted transcriptional regulator